MTGFQKGVALLVVYFLCLLASALFDVARTLRAMGRGPRR